MATGGVDVNLSEETFDAICSICRRNGLIKEAVKYCLDCCKNVCDNCVRIHSEHIESHTLIDGPGDEEEASILTEKCSEHKKELIKYYCVEDDAVLCSMCALSRHKRCKNLRYLPDAAGDNLTADEQIQKLPYQMILPLTKVERTINSMDNHIERLQEKEDGILEQIDGHTARLIDRLLEMSSRTKSEITAKCQQLISETTQNRDACMVAKYELGKIMGDIRKSDKGQVQVFILSKRGQSIMKEIETLAATSSELIKNSQFGFIPEWEIEQCMEDVGVLGRVIEPYKATLKGKITVKVKRDAFPCIIHGFCVLPDGTVVFVDRNNTTLKHVDPATGLVMNHFDLRVISREVTCISQNEVAVSSGSTDVRVISLVGKMKLKRTLKLGHVCCNIVQSKGELITSDKTCLYVHDLSGKLLRTIGTNEDGKDMFCNIEGFTVTPDGDKIFVVDWTLGLVCFSRSGRQLYWRSGEQMGLSEARDVCTDDSGNVMVCGWSSNNVVQISDKGHLIGEILRESDGLHKPVRMTYDASRHRLYLVSWFSTELLVYELT